MMSEDLFFNKVKATMHGYAPEVPASVYGGMRRKYAKSKFFSWNASTLNVWYVALVAVLGAVVIGTSLESNTTATKAGVVNTTTEYLPVEIPSAPEFVVTEAGSCAQSPSILNHYKGEPCLFPSSKAEVKNEPRIVQPSEVQPTVTEVVVTQNEEKQEEEVKVVPAEEVILKEEPKKPTRKLKASVYKDKQ
jgi:hypothetical protein